MGNILYKDRQDKGLNKLIDMCTKYGFCETVL